MKNIELNDLIEILKEYNPEEVEFIKRAYEYASDLHKGQYRQSGEPYISHPLNVLSSSAWASMRSWWRISPWMMTSSARSGAVWAIRCCCVLPCSKLEASPRVFSRRTKSGGRFLNGLCTSTKRPDQSKNEGHVQSHQEAACLLRERGASRRAAFLSAQRACGDQHSGHVHGHPHAAVFPAGDV